MKAKLLYLVAFCLFLFFTFCKKKLENRPRWATEILTPIVRTTLTPFDIFTDSSLQVKQDQGLSIVQREQLYSYGLDSLIQLQVTPFDRHETLESLVLSGDTITYSVTLGQIARQLRDQGDPTGQLILDSQGKKAIVPLMTGLTAGPFLINLSNLFQSATIKTGTLTMAITNGLPVNLSNVTMEMRNYSSNSLVLQETFSSIPKNSTTAPVSADLAGKTIEGKLNTSITNMDIGAGYVTIDTNDALTALITISNLTVQQATAVFPAQQVISDEQNSALTGMKDVRLVKAKLKSGKIILDASTTAQDTIYFTYDVPVASINGVPFSISGKVAPAAPGGTTSLHREYDFTGYDLDLTGKNKDTFNVIYNKISASLAYTGREVTFSLSDYLDIHLTFVDASPLFVQGFLGQDTITIDPTEVAFSFFKNVQANKIDFKSVNLSMEIENGLGVKGDFSVDYVSASNSQQTLTMLNPTSGTVAPATDNPLKPSDQIFPIQSTNPAPVDLLNLRPDKVGFAGTVYLNKGVSNTDFSGFAYDSSSLYAYLDVELPLNAIAENLILVDTVAFTPATISSNIGDGTLNILAYNGFPLDASLTILFYDKNFSPIDTLVSPNRIAAAPVDPKTGKITDQKFSKIPFILPLSRLNNLLKAQNIVFEARFWTEPSNTYTKIYSDYSIELRLTGDFNYTVTGK